MLFSSWTFIAIFLPVVWFGYRLLMSHAGRRAALAFLTLASLFFYGWFRWDYLLIILASIGLNFVLGNYLAESIHQGKTAARRTVLLCGLLVNIAALVYYKYTGLFLATFNDLAGTDVVIPAIVLPIGISFFTFQSIAWLIDAWRGQGMKTNLLDYTLFITFFSQLIAGPIVHHGEMMPQFVKPPSEAKLQRLLAAGLSVFLLGLFKKVVIADNMGQIADPIFDAAALGTPLTLIEAWLGPLAYTLQIYFDFSGYSDMAVGLAAMFGVRLPLNFFSPYKSGDIIEFWRRWHMTLSRFLRDYLYIPLGGNRHGTARRHVNLMATMLLGGLWHGANWTFLLWGGLHGIYLVIAHMWKRLSLWRLPKPVAVLLTFISVMLAWIFFRADSIQTGLHILKCMGGINGLALQDTHGALANALRALGVDVHSTGGSRNLRINEKWYILWVSLAAVFVLPSMHEVMRGRVALDVTGVAQNVRSMFKMRWQPSVRWMIVTALAAGLAMTMLTRVNAFIYFQF